MTSSLHLNDYNYFNFQFCNTTVLNIYLFSSLFERACQFYFRPTLKLFKNPRTIISRWGWFCCELFLKVEWPRGGVNNEAVVSGWGLVVAKGGAQAASDCMQYGWDPPRGPLMTIFKQGWVWDLQLLLWRVRNLTTPLRTSDKLKFYKFDYLDEGEDVYKRSCVGKGPALLGGFWVFIPTLKCTLNIVYILLVIL